MTRALLGAEHSEEPRIIDDFVIDEQVGDPEVMERCQHVVFKCVLQRDAICYNVIEQAVHVVAIGSVGSCGHTEEKGRRKVIHDGSVAIRTAAMRLVDDDVVEFGRIEFDKVPLKRFNHGECALRSWLGRAGSVCLIGVAIAEDRFEALFRCIENTHSVSDEQHALRFGCENVEC